MTPQLAKAVVDYAKAAPPFSDATVAGPWWQQIPPSVAVMPFCRFIIIGAGEADWFTNATYLERVRLRFSIFHTNNDLAFTYSNLISDRFRNASLTLDRGICVGCLPAALPYSVDIPAPVRDASANPVYHVVTDIRFWLSN